MQKKEKAIVYFQFSIIRMKVALKFMDLISTLEAGYIILLLSF